MAQEYWHQACDHIKSYAYIWGGFDQAQTPCSSYMVAVLNIGNAPMMLSIVSHINVVSSLEETIRANRAALTIMERDRTAK
jgi:hypothetical protein